MDIEKTLEQVDDTVTVAASKMYEVSGAIQIVKPELQAVATATGRDEFQVVVNFLDHLLGLLPKKD